MDILLSNSMVFIKKVWVPYYMKEDMMIFNPDYCEKFVIYPDQF